MMQAIPKPAGADSNGDPQYSAGSTRKPSMGIPSGSMESGSIRRSAAVGRDRNGKYHFVHQQPADKRRPSVSRKLDERSQHKKQIGEAMGRILGEPDAEFLPPRNAPATPKRHGASAGIPGTPNANEQSLDRPSDHVPKAMKSSRRRTSSRNVSSGAPSKEPSSRLSTRSPRRERDPPTPRKHKQPSVRKVKPTLMPTSQASSEQSDAQSHHAPPTMVPTKAENEEHHDFMEPMSPSNSPSGSVSTKKSRGRSISKRFRRGSKKESKRDVQQQLLSGGTEPNESFLSAGEDPPQSPRRSRSRSGRFQDTIKENFEELRRRRKQSRERRSKRFDEGDVKRSTRQAAFPSDAGLFPGGRSDVENSPHSTSSRRGRSASGRLGKMLDRMRSRSASKRRNDARSVASTPVDSGNSRRSTRSALSEAVGRHVRAMSSDARRRRRNEDDEFARPSPQQDEAHYDEEDPYGYSVPSKANVPDGQYDDGDDGNRRHSMAAQRTRPLPMEEEEFASNVPGPRPQSMMLHREVTRRTKANSLSDLQAEYSQEDLPSTSYFASNHILVNRERMKRGLKPCTRNKAMDEIARDHAQRMAESAGCQPIQTTFIGNVLRGESIRAIHKSTMQNKQGRERYNILNPYFQEFGIGTAKGEDGMLYMCQLFSESLTLTCKDAVNEKDKEKAKPAEAEPN